MWFNKALPNIELLWKIIQTEKHIDYSHRQPKKRMRKEKDLSNVSDITTSNRCLLDLDLQILDLQILDLYYICII